ncbi:ficolin-1-B [Aplysia californica]|uniref:Ficolin-1-B n=1 Tax=Aplysia californica TaxID=6500 RepID=A0ABM1AB32_APLCA|nr:ficolin-1-B [Aplysia californica]XP_012944308.1 ficolin-1-B [Aplysia californica]XP_035828634.1 ficolin-1-B [Aplysia californica]
MWLRNSVVSVGLVGLCVMVEVLGFVPEDVLIEVIRSRDLDEKMVNDSKHTIDGWYEVELDNCEQVVHGRKIVQMPDGTYVPCDGDTDGGRWTVIQRRIHSDGYFTQDWLRYEIGFGFPEDDFWLGLHSVSELTRLWTHQLRVDFTTKNGRDYNFTYNLFRILPGQQHFRLQVAEPDPPSPESKSLLELNDIGFTNADKYNGPSGKICSKSYSSGWWYTGCDVDTKVYLNGQKSLNWVDSKWAPLTDNDPIVKSEMKIRKLV